MAWKCNINGREKLYLHFLLGNEGKRQFKDMGHRSTSQFIIVTEVLVVCLNITMVKLPPIHTAGTVAYYETGTENIF
jgi:hypothetical protein